MAILPLTERTIDAVYDATCAAFYAHMQATLPASLVAFENDGFDPDKVFDAVSPQNDAWVRFSMQFTPGIGGQSGPGSNVYRRFGIVLVQGFTRVNTGRLLANTQAEGVIGFFESKQAPVPGVSFYNAAPNEAGDDGAWYQINVSAEFRWDTLRRT